MNQITEIDEIYNVTKTNKIYIVVTHSRTNLSKIIKHYLRSEFSHVSISLDIELERMYSFGRLHPYNPFRGGFVHEQINTGTFKRFSKTTSKVYSIDITEQQYEKVESIIASFIEHKYDYRFNVPGLLGVVINKKIHPKKAFFCAEFVKYVLETAGIENNLPSIPKPDDFKFLEGNVLIYKGILRKYTYSENN